MNEYLRLIEINALQDPTAARLWKRRLPKLTIQRSALCGWSIELHKRSGAWGRAETFTLTAAVRAAIHMWRRMP